MNINVYTSMASSKPLLLFTLFRVSVGRHWITGLYRESRPSDETFYASLTLEDAEFWADQCVTRHMARTLKGKVSIWMICVSSHSGVFRSDGEMADEVTFNSSDIVSVDRLKNYVPRSCR